MTFPTDNPAFRQAAFSQPQVKRPQNQALSQTQSEQIQAAQNQNLGAPRQALPDFFVGFHPDLARQFLIGVNVLEPLTFPIPSPDSFDVEAMLRLATKMAGADGQLVKEEVQAFLQNNQLSPDLRNMANFLNNNFQMIQQKLVAMIFVPPGVALIMAEGFRPEDLRKIAALDGDPKRISALDLRTPVRPPDEVYSTDDVMALAKRLAGNDGQLSKEELEKNAQADVWRGPDHQIAAFLLKNYDAIYQKQQELRPQLPDNAGAPFFIPSGLVVEEFPQIARLDGDPRTFGTRDLQVKVTPPVKPPISKETFDTNQIIEFALGVAGKDGILTRNELEGLMWPAVMDPRVIQGQNMQRFLLDNFQAIQEKLIALNPLPLGVAASLPLGINPRELAKLARLDGKPETFGIADLKAPIQPPIDPPNNNTSVPTRSVLTVIRRAGGGDGNLTRAELQKYLKTPNLSKSAIRVANFLLQNFQGILDKLNQLDRDAGIVNVRARTEITAQDIQRLVGTDGDNNNLSLDDIKGVAPPPPPPINGKSALTDSVVTIVQNAGGKDAVMTLEEMRRYFQNVKPSRETAQAIEFIQNNYQALLAKAQALGLSIRSPITGQTGLTAEAVIAIAKLDGNPKVISLKDLNSTPPPPEPGQFSFPDGVVWPVLERLDARDGQDGNIKRETIEAFLNEVHPDSMQFAFAKVLLEHFRVLSTVTYSGSGAFLPDDPNWQPTREHVNLNLNRFRSIMSKPGDTEAQARIFDNSDLVGVEQQVFPPPPTMGGGPGFGGGPGPAIQDELPRILNTQEPGDVAQ